MVRISLIWWVEYQLNAEKMRKIRCNLPLTALDMIVLFAYLNSECDTAQLHETVDLFQSQPVAVVACR